MVTVSCSKYVTERFLTGTLHHKSQVGLQAALRFAGRSLKELQMCQQQPRVARLRSKCPKLVNTPTNEELVNTDLTELTLIDDPNTQKQVATERRRDRDREKKTETDRKREKEREREREREREQ